MVRSTLLLASILIGIGLALVVGTPRSPYLHNNGSNQKTMWIVPVAKQALAMGFTVHAPEESFSLCERDWDEVPEGAFTHVNWNALRDQCLKRSLRPGQIPTDDDILHPKGMGPIPGLPRGGRAVGMRISGTPTPLRAGVVVDIYSGVKCGSTCQVIARSVSILGVDSVDDKIAYVGLLPENCLKVMLALEAEETVYFLKAAEHRGNSLPVDSILREAIARTGSRTIGHCPICFSWQPWAGYPLPGRVHP